MIANIFYFDSGFDGKADSGIQFELVYGKTLMSSIFKQAHPSSKSSLERVNMNIAFLTFMNTNTTQNCQVFLSFYSLFILY